MSELVRAWVGCLGCLTGADLVGEWFDAGEIPQDMSDFDAAMPALPNYHFEDRHEELWVMDHKGYGDFLKGECSPVTAARIAEAIAEIPEWVPAEAVAVWLENQGMTLESWSAIEDDFNDSYQGEYSDDEEMAEQLAEDIGFVEPNGWPYNCIDWEKAARELMFDGYWSTPSDKGNYYFRDC